jgi:hypothetical protein
MKGGQFIGQMDNYQLLKTESMKGSEKRRERAMLPSS